MKRTVETKFNVGDIVYVADHYYDFYAQKTPYIITDVLIDINGQRTMIRYDAECKNGSCRIPEEWVFETYTECTKWCEEHN
jgi:hypothetical protein